MLTDVFCTTLGGRGSRHSSRDYRIIVPAPYNFSHKSERGRLWESIDQQNLYLILFKPMKIDLAQDGQATGPFTKDQIELCLSTGQLSLSDQAGGEGCLNWGTLANVIVNKPSERCPSCSSENWKLVKSVYQEGLQAVNLAGKTLGASVGSGGVNVGLASTKTGGTIQSLASERCSPPTPDPDGQGCFAFLSFFNPRFNFLFFVR